MLVNILESDTIAAWRLIENLVPVTFICFSNVVLNVIFIYSFTNKNEEKLYAPERLGLSCGQESP
ncbi:MAG: hypothetical protein CL877_06935 [Dehalococcoidales bacterium]|jgi:hypothetical protein|nr:hypothetical protein [Dehalococcoidales bacterium]